MSAIMSPVGRLAELFTSEGAADYLGEPVTVAQHLLQAGALASAAGAPDALVAAALLHDAGHLRGADPLADEAELSGRELMGGTDNDHGERGAAWLARWFGPAPTPPAPSRSAAGTMPPRTLGRTCRGSLATVPCLRAWCSPGNRYIDTSGDVHTPGPRPGITPKIWLVVGSKFLLTWGGRCLS
jgi:hypothetical protein